MNGIRKLAFHAARYNRQKYLDSDVRSRPLQSVRRAFFSYRTVVILHREQPHPRKPYRGIQRTSSKDSPVRIFVVARQQRAVPLYAEKFFGIQRYSSLPSGDGKKPRRRTAIESLKTPPLRLPGLGLFPVQYYNRPVRKKSPPNGLERS